MRNNPFASDAILTEEEVVHVRNKVVTTFQEVMVARKIFPIENSDDAYFYKFYDEEEVSQALITHSGKPQSDDFPDLTPHDIPWPVIHKESLLNWRDVRMSQQGNGSKLLDRTIRNLTTAVARAEDRLLISGECLPGWPALGIDGLFTATGRFSVAQSGNWPANAIADINLGRAALQGAGFVSIEPILLGPPAMIKCLDAQMANTTSTYRQFLLDNNLISAAMESANAYAADCGQDSVVLVVPGEDNFWAAQGIPLSTRVWEDKTGNVYLTVRETLVPVIGRATSIYEITGIQCS
jgi:uncharacterized linocin/CFP29 family protein